MGLFRREDTLIEVLSDASASLPQVAAAFRDVMQAEPEHRAAAIERVAQVEALADQRYEAALTAIAAARSTPFNREDLYELAEGIDDVVDAMDHTCQLLEAYDVGTLPDGFLAQAEDLVEICDIAADAVLDLRNPDDLVSRWREINALQTQVNQRHRIIAAILLDGSREVFEAIKLKEVAETIEVVADLVDNYIRSLALVVMKET